MTEPVDVSPAEILTYFRTSNRDVWRYRAVNEYVDDANDGVRMLRDATSSQGAASVIPIVEKAIASTFRVLMRADDSNGGIQWVISELLALHVDLCRVAPPSPAKLGKWMMAHQFGEPGEYFELDVIDYVPALGESGLARYRRELEARERALTLPYSPRPQEWSKDSESHARRTLLSNAQRFAVLERDEETIVTTHGGDQPHAYRRHKAADALVEAHFEERAIVVAREGMDAPGGDHQRRQCADLWGLLIRRYRPNESLEAAELLFERWPGSDTAARLRDAYGADWPQHRERVICQLRPWPYRLIPFLLGDGDAQRAWDEAHAGAKAGRGALSMDQWDELVAAYRRVDPVAVLSVMTEQILSLLEVADTRRYPQAVRRMKALKKDATTAGRPDIADHFVAEIRSEFRRRPSLIERMDRAGLV